VAEVPELAGDIGDAVDERPPLVLLQAAGDELGAHVYGIGSCCRSERYASSIDGRDSPRHYGSGFRMDESDQSSPAPLRIGQAAKRQSSSRTASDRHR